MNEQLKVSAIMLIILLLLSVSVFFIIGERGRTHLYDQLGFPCWIVDDKTIIWSSHQNDTYSGSFGNRCINYVKEKQGGGK